MTQQLSLKRCLSISSTIAFCLTIYPPIQAALLGGTAAITTFFAADAFYYLSIAANSSFGRYTFDGRLLTNGFHPLWQILLQFVVSHLSVKSGLPPMIAAFVLSILASGFGLAWLAAGLSRLSRAIWPVFLLFPGIYFLVVSPIDPRFGSTWSFINGMESPLSVLFFGMFFFFLTNGQPLYKPLNLLILSLLSLGILMSRLDDVFLLITFGVWFVLNQRKTVGWIVAVRQIGIYAAPIVAGLAAYLFFNWKTVGVLLPTSGAAKSDGLALVKNLAWLLAAVAPFSSALLHRIYSNFPNQIAGLSLAWRLAQMLVPMAIAAFLLKRRDLRDWVAQGYSSTFAMLLSYVLVKGGYNLIFVPLIRQGHWYYPVSILIVDVTLALVIVRAVQQISSLVKIRQRGPALTLFAFAWLCGVCLVWRVLSPTYQNTLNTQTLARGSLIRSELNARVGSVRMIEFDDGILNYALSTPTLSGFGLASDAATEKAMRRGELLSYAADSGYNLIGSVNYSLVGSEQLASDQLRDQLGRSDFLRREDDLGRFNFSIVYFDPVIHASFIRFSRR